MAKRCWWLGVAVTTTLIIAVVGVSGQKAPPAAPTYPAPRSPAPAPAVRTVDDVMPYARDAARNKSNILGLGLGVLNAGETVLLVPTVRSEAPVVEAIKRALEERKVNVRLLYDYGFVNVTRDQAAALEKAAPQRGGTEVGYLEASGWVSSFGNDAGRAWLKTRRPDLHDKLFPAKTQQQLPKDLQAVRDRMRGSGTVKGIVAYLEKHPEVRGVFYGKGGPLWMAFHPVEHKWLGTFTQDDHDGLVTHASGYPADVWMLTEELTMEPLAYTDQVHVTDPEGTDVSWTMTTEQSNKWAKGAYLRGHIFLFPQEAYGQYALSVVNYPALQKEWISPEPRVLINGVVAGTNGHWGFFPRIEEHFKNGYLADVKGGGLYGETLREFMKYPKINDIKYPFFERPGYFFHFETALGTNPKITRLPLDYYRGLSPERMRSGVFHWGIGNNIWNDPGSHGGRSEVSEKFADEHGLPSAHGFHIHTYFTTYKVHLRNTDKWVTLTDRGRMTALDNPEVRALASRYGDPNQILAETWIPELPGINAPGRYETDYAPDPYPYAKRVEAQVQAGTYPHMVKTGQKPARKRR